MNAWGWRIFATHRLTMVLSKDWTSISNQSAISPLPLFRLSSFSYGNSSASGSRRNTSASTLLWTTRRNYHIEHAGISQLRNCNEYYKRPLLTSSLNVQDSSSFSVPLLVWLVWICNGSSRSTSSAMLTARRKFASKGRKPTWKPSFRFYLLPSKSFQSISRTRKRTS